MRPSDSLFAFGLGSGCPLPLAFRRAGAVVRGPRVRPQTRRPRGLMTGAPRRRNSFGANRVSQVTGLSSGCVPCFQTPPGAFATRPFSAAIAVAFSEYGPLGTPECHSFRGQLCTAHGPACLRFAGVVTFTVARLASGVSGLTLHRAGFAPAGQHTRFLEAIASSDPPRPAGPGRTMPLIRR